MVQAARTGAGGRLFRLLIGALVLASAAAQFALVPVMPVYARRFGLSGFEQGMVLGATGLATLVVSVPAGTMSDRFGPRRITLAAGLLMAAATAAQALAGGFPVLLAARLAFGAGYGMVWTAGLCWLAGAAAAVVAAGLSTGVCALLVPALLHAAGASPGQIGLDFAVAGILFAAGSALTAMAGRRAVNLPVACGGMLVLAAALTPAVVGATPLPLVVMLCVTTAARAVLWTVSYPLAAAAARAGPGASSRSGQGDAGLGASIGLLNLIWAATAVLGPLGAGLAAGRLGAGAAFGLTQAACAVALAATVAAAWRGRRGVRAGMRHVARGCGILMRCICCPRTGQDTGSSTPNGSARPSPPWTAPR